MDDRLDIPKYEMVRNYIAHLIKDDIIAYGERLPSEHELTEKFSVSRHTVRQALAALVAEGLVSSEQGRGSFSSYNKNAKGRQIIAVITTYIAGFVFPGIISGIEQVLSDEGCMMLLSNTNNIKAREAQYLQSVLDHGVSGLIIEPTRSAYANDNLRLLEETRSRGIPSVFINACYGDFDSACVVMDDEQGGHMAAEHLLRLGHRRIAGIFKTDDRQGVERKRGYLRALAEYGVPALPEDIGEFTTAEMFDFPYMFTQKRLSLPNPPTAVVCYNDQYALMVAQAIRDKGLCIPDDISVVGYDDSISPSAADAFTSVRHPKRDMGEQAARFLIGMLEGRLERPRRVFAPELVVRASTRTIEPINHPKGDLIWPNTL
jgi:GntR family transcriptional regulator of arabinose operon